METKDRKEQLFQYLELVLKRAEKKFKIDRGQREELNLKWGRLIVQAVHEYGYLLKSEEIEIRLSELEEKLRHGVLIPDGSQQATKSPRR